MPYKKVKQVREMINEDALKFGENRSAIRNVFEYSLKRKSEIGKENVFDFSLGNPSIEVPNEFNNAIIDLVKNENSLNLHGYSVAQGDEKVRNVIAENIFKKFSFPAKKEDIYVTAGAAAAISTVLKAVAIKGDEVICFAPFFPEYAVFIKNAQAKLITVTNKAPEFGINIKELEKSITEKTAAVIINSPNNPTGHICSEKEIENLSSLLLKKEKEYGHPIYLISDEPYRELAYEKEVPYIPNYYSDTIVAYSYSKSLSIPGERIGYIMVSNKIKENRKVYNAICGAGRMLGFVCAPSLMQQIIGRIDGVTADIGIYKENRDLLSTALKEIGYEFTTPDGAFYLFLKAPDGDAERFCRFALKKELMLVPSDSFGVKGYVRISYCVSTQMIKKSIPAFKELYEEYLRCKND